LQSKPGRDRKKPQEKSEQTEAMRATRLSSYRARAAAETPEEAEVWRAARRSADKFPVRPAFTMTINKSQGQTQRRLVRGTRLHARATLRRRLPGRQTGLPSDCHQPVAAWTHSQCCF